jgi:hypothetical protein
MQVGPKLFIPPAPQTQAPRFDIQFFLPEGFVTGRGGSVILNGAYGRGWPVNISKAETADGPRLVMRDSDGSGEPVELDLEDVINLDQMLESSTFSGVELEAFQADVEQVRRWMALE